MEYDNLADPNIRDSLTGLLNQNSFMAALASEIYCGSKGYLVRFDIEHFSSINSLFGYSEGDNMLKKIGKILQADADKYNSFASRASADIFFIYLPISEDEVKDYIIELDSKLKEISDVLDIRLIFGASSIDVASSQQAVENCNIAADSVRDHEDMIFTIYNKELMEELITKKNEALDIVDKIRNHKIKVGFRKIYDNTNKVVAFDSGCFSDVNDFKMKKENLFLFLERNKMIVKLNQMASKAVYKLMSECWNELEGYTFIAYVSRVYLENDHLRRNLIKFINDTNIPNDKYVLSVQCDSCGKNKKKMIEAFNDILSNGIQLNIDFSNNTKFDYTLFSLVNIKNVKVDLRNFVNMQDGSIDYFLIENLVKAIIRDNGTIYVGHADKKVVEILNKYKNAYYSLDNEPILSSEEVLKEFKNKKI
jgi:diguanylate cyclase (GGDEF)-like protein